MTNIADRQQFTPSFTLGVDVEFSREIALSPHSPLGSLVESFPSRIKSWQRPRISTLEEPRDEMAIALSEFWTRLIESGITDSDGCRSIASSFCDAHGGTPPSEPLKLAKFLIKSGGLTEFQARSILAGRDLRVGPFVIRSEKPPAPLSRWVAVQAVGGGPSGFLFLASSDEHLGGGRDQWLEAHAGVSGESLLSIEVQPIGNKTGVFSPLPEGKCLHELTEKQGKIQRRRACQIGIEIADALVALHGRSLIHGQVRSDRVWITSERKAVLLRDPSGPAVKPSPDRPGGWLDNIESDSAYSAPEFGSEDQDCNPATDIYSLGCLLYRMVAGRPPVTGKTFAQAIAAHASETPKELSDAIQKGESGDPFYRVIAFAMAKNPAARFSSAQQLSDALGATLKLIPSTKPAAETVVEKTPHDAAADAKKKTPQKKVSAKPSNPPPATTTPPPATTTSPAEGSAASPTTAPPAALPTAQAAVTIEAPGHPVSSGPPPLVSNLLLASEPPLVSDPPVLSEPPAVSDPPAVSEPLVVSEPLAKAIDPESSKQSERSPARRRKKKKSRAPLILGGLCLPVLIMMIVLMTRDTEMVPQTRREHLPNPPVISSAGTRSPGGSSASDAESEPGNLHGYELVVDERLLWVPPYAADSETAPLELLPPGPGVIVSVRLGRLRASAVGKEIVDLLSPEISQLIELSSQRSKVPVDSIRRCSIALHPGADGWPEVSLAIELDTALPLSELTERWGASASRTSAGQTIYAGDDVGTDAFYIVPSDDESSVSRFAVGSVKRITEVAENEGGPISLPPSLQRLWSRSSDQADLVVLVTPNFLFADARSMLVSVVPELVRPLRAVLIPDIAGALVTADVVDEGLYAEVRVVPSGSVSEAVLMRQLTAAIGDWPQWADRFVQDSVPDASWRLLANRLPSMMRFVSGETRFGISGGNVVANVYLPARAASQVPLTLLLALNTRAGASTAVAVVTPAKALTVQEMLDRKMSVSFDQESLEFAINTIVDEFKRSLPPGSSMPPVRIIGGDLEKMGITQNQQIRDFSKSDLPLRKVLTDLVLGANPDRTASGPNDPKQALVWVVTDDPESPQKKVILVTTRAAAENQYELPDEFVVPEN